MGYIYILTNPSFPQYVKIGYATDVKQRLDELNRSSAVPFAFRVYATYEVDSALSDKKLHSAQPDYSGITYSSAPAHSSLRQIEA